MKFKFYKHLEPAEREAWSEFIIKHPQGSYFQTPTAFDLFSTSHEFLPFYFVVTNDDNKIIAIQLSVIWADRNKLSGKLFPKTISWGGPVVAEIPEKNEVFVFLLTQAALAVENKSVYSEIRNFSDTFLLKKLFGYCGYIYKSHLNCTLRVTGNSDLLKRINKSKKKQINTSLENGATIKIADHIDEVKALYMILRNLYHKKVGKPLPSIDLFTQFLKIARNSDSGVILLVIYNNQVIGGCICPVFMKKTIYEWYICGKDNVFKKKGIYPSVLATWAIIDYAQKQGIEKVDFMGIGRPGEKYGVRDFKLKFGGEVYPYGRYLKVTNKFLYGVGKTGISLMKLIGRHLK